MTGAFRLLLRSTETRPSRETQESVLPALSQKFGSRVSITATDLSPDQRLQAARIGTVTVDDPETLCDVYEYLQSNRLVKIATIQTDDAGGVVTRKTHEIDREAVERREDATIVGTARGDLLIRIRGDDAP